jgi:hypothetical protein
LLKSGFRRHKAAYSPKKPKVKKYEVNLRRLDIAVNALINAWLDVTGEFLVSTHIKML